MRSYLGAAGLLACISFAPAAGAQEPQGPPASDVAETGRKLSNPVSDVWALFARFDANFSEGDVNSGHAKVGGRMIIQPILPVPFFGSAEKRWNLITRPTIPLLFGAPVPTGLNSFDHKWGVGDLQLPIVLSPPTGDWLLGAGPALLVPISTDDAFSHQQWGIGPALVVGKVTKAATFGAFGQYYFGLGTPGDGEPGLQNASYMNLLYFLFVNLPNAWQFGFDPTITYDARASSGNKWNVPVGMLVAKTTLIGKLPVKFQFGVEYSVVSQETFGERGKLVLEVIPVIPALIGRPILGGH